ncbi:MAG: T9SS type A sorting domain-containing protein [Candidatus Azobacteroides sp.]|nr:T9SS type A sorting domain-containing protein [Candidatus Azobacteroides sp.]
MKQKLSIIAILCFLMAHPVKAEEIYYWNSLPVGGAGFVTGIVTCSQEKNLIYARTDVGGAYRWMEETKSWKPIADFLSESTVSYMGVESMAIDPQEPNKLYLYCGTSYWNGGRSAILYSDDYGKTFVEKAIVTSQFPAHGNDNGRQSGERLSVDPNKGNVLLCGSRTRGLWKSVDGGASWTRLANAIFPDNRKVAFVQYIPNSTTPGNATPEIYVGLQYSGGNNLFVSSDGGDSWQAVENQTTTYRAHRCLLSNGKLYITYTDTEGPSTNGKGAVKKYDLAAKTWTDISPDNFSFGEVSVDPENPDRLLVTTLSVWQAQTWITGNTTWGDQIFISTNDGMTWKNLFSPLSVSYNEPTIEWLKKSSQMHWTGSSKIDPFNRNRAFFISGNGIYLTENLWDAKPVFKMAVTNLEETVPNELVSLPGAPVATVVADYDGFVYPDITKFQDRYNPTMGTTTGLGVAGKAPYAMVRTGSDLYWSENGGESWSKLSKPFSTASNGWCAVGADGQCIVATPSDAHPYYTFNKGASWTEMPGITANNIRFFADYEKENVFYANVNNTLRAYTYNETAGAFEYTSVSLPEAYNNRLTVVPGISGEIWYPRNTGGLGRITDAHTANPSITIIPLNAATCVGVGKAAGGKSYPSLYIWGKPANTDPMGLYRSDDEGVNWIRINDDSHQFGGPGNAQFVKGDMNVYGRVYMSTVGRGIIYGELKSDETALPKMIRTGKAKISKVDDRIILETSGICSYRIYNASGILVEKNTCDQTQMINPKLTPGIYIIRLETQSGIETMKFVK